MCGAEQTQEKVKEKVCGIIAAPVGNDDPAARAQDAVHLRQGGRGTPEEVKGARRNHHVTGPVPEGQGLGVPFPQVEVASAFGTGDCEHFGRHVDPRQPRLGDREGYGPEKFAGAASHVQDPVAGTDAGPFECFTDRRRDVGFPPGVVAGSQRRVFPPDGAVIVPLCIPASWPPLS